jgi:hypothetical protein
MGLAEPIGGDAVRAIDGVTGLANPGNGVGKALTLVHRFCIVQSKRIEHFDTDVDGPHLPATAHGPPRWPHDLSAPADTEATARSRPSNVYLWAILLARIYEISPLICSRCGGPVRIVAFITEAAPVQQILQHIGEPHEPPPLHPPRGPPNEAVDDQTVCLDDDVNQDRYEFEPDQRLNW